MFTLRHIDGDALDAGVLSESMHMTTARRRAIRLAVEAGRSVAVVAAGKVRLVVQPDGSFAPPPGVLVQDRAKHKDGPGPCFCPPCRAARAAR